MQRAQLLVYFETSPALRLLRSPNAPFIIDFLYQQFKKSGHIAASHSDLQAALAAYSEQLRDAYPESLRDKPEVYLSTWCSAETRWLHRFLEADRNEPMYQLTPHTEDVLSFLDRVLEQDLGFVGTESRLRLVIETLADLVIKASDDPEVRLVHLRAEKRRLEEEIARIEREGSVARYQPAQIRERFTMAVSLLKQLQGDFRAVEEKFKAITQQVQQRHNEGRDSRGGILEFALDSEDILKREDQGVSFHEFVRFILSPSQQDKLQTIIEQLSHISELTEQMDGLDTVRRMVPLLLAEAEKVMRTNQRLSATLRRLLDVRAHRERQHVAQLLKQIRELAAAVAGDHATDTVGVEIESNIEIASPFARTFWREPPRFSTIDLAEHVVDEQSRVEAFRQLAQMQPLDWRGMRRRVSDAVSMHGTRTLAQLLADYPPKGGPVEVLGYLQIANDDGHSINRDEVERIVLLSRSAGGPQLIMMLPLVTFRPQRRNIHAAR